LHEAQRASFFASGLLFWIPVVEPNLEKWPQWSIPLYLFLATLPCDALSAFLTFSDRVVYPSYLSAPRLLNISPLQDQEMAGALMWVFVTFIYAIPAITITIRILSPKLGRRGPDHNLEGEFLRGSTWHPKSKITG
jgi:cytochrome c oxidase assembly factor CtaG